jgi:DNA-binding IclR family transcriptional regulator
VETPVSTSRSDPTDGTAEPAEIQAVSRAAQILALFGPDTPELTAAEAAERLGLNRSTAYRYCTSLVAAGLLERGLGAGGFVPGGLLLQLGAFALGRRKVMDLATPYLRELSSGTHLTAVLSLWGSAGAVVSRVEEDPARTALVTVRVGTQLPLDAAQAKVFLAFLRDQLTVNRLLGNLPDVQRANLTTELEHVRATGHVAGVTADGIVAVAAPVLDEHGICATIAVIGTERAFGPSGDTTATAATVVGIARELSKEMGAEYPATDL